ncbi:MAG: VOC family protein, partial [Oceanicaulis sp.]
LRTPRALTCVRRPFGSRRPAKEPAITATPSPLVPYLSVRGGFEALEFYKTAFGAEVHDTYEHEGRLCHAGLTLNGAALHLADEFPETEATTGFVRAVEAGCTPVRGMTDGFYGRHGKLRDPFGHVWSIVTIRAGA